MESSPLPPPQPATNKTTSHHLISPPLCLPAEQFESLILPSIAAHHTYTFSSMQRQSSSLLIQPVSSPLPVVWSILRQFDRPQSYKHFIKSCRVGPEFSLAPGSTRFVDVISGLPASTSSERLDILDDSRHITGFTVVGGDHRLRNYRSVTTCHEITPDGEEGAGNPRTMTVVVESYIVDVPEGNTEEDTKLFADTVVRLNLQKLASVAEGLTKEGLTEYSFEGGDGGHQNW
ncbi:hypothetical protein MLD38_018332 [Melastoma candidum]|uniref:Uncharacterized protein n=1 Tax=Melastoma candidum TaxID=119954 RepID=A0ACB9QVF4_9MYRT|nr:hypothetical protein MLD38_018332 [Melastoma candidum]